ncbi:single Ig IL-1-related receptor isoform X1 [Microcaecilia unicolor]|uniref:Single Ig IL-1-related receptor isoform X1 n=1 Tax=Microcaecilia unicolor TaxID=1415580 RepID=A0A6P7XX05_9AMPH|nr:single Ig IL-1-related receptor isoform X1 [Microcaecilia unicolor]
MGDRKVQSPGIQTFTFTGAGTAAISTVQSETEEPRLPDCLLPTNQWCWKHIPDLPEQVENTTFAVGLAMAANPCSASVQFLSPSGSQVLEPPLGSQLALNCTAVLPYNVLCHSTFHWMKDGILLESESKQSSWENISANQQFLSSILEINITGSEDYGVFSCLVHNKTATFTLNRTEEAGHLVAVLCALVVLSLLLVGTLLYVKCRLNILLWYKDKYGDIEINDGKLYDAYVSYSSSTNDKKFANFILKPHLENRYGYKLYLDDKNILPSSEPSAELIMNVSRCRRLIVVLSLAYLEQDWCTSNFREGLWRLMELSQKPIFIVFASQYKDLAHPVIQLLKQYKRTLCLLLWKSGSMVWEEDRAGWRDSFFRLLEGTVYGHATEDFMQE